jgi:hypothetical protein
VRQDSWEIQYTACIDRSVPKGVPRREQNRCWKGNVDLVSSSSNERLHISVTSLSPFVGICISLPRRTSTSSHRCPSFLISHLHLHPTPLYASICSRSSTRHTTVPVVGSLPPSPPSFASFTPSSFVGVAMPPAPTPVPTAFFAPICDPGVPGSTMFFPPGLSLSRPVCAPARPPAPAPAEARTAGVASIYSLLVTVEKKGHARTKRTRLRKVKGGKGRDWGAEKKSQGEVMWANKETKMGMTDDTTNYICATPLEESPPHTNPSHTMQNPTSIPTGL